MTDAPSIPGRALGAIRLSLMLLAVSLASTVVMGQNLLLNSNLNGSTTPWLAEGSLPPNPTASGSATWTNLFNNDNILNGSGSVDTVLTGAAAQGANSSYGIEQCIQLPNAPVSVSEAYYAARFLAPTSNPSDVLSMVTVGLRFSSYISCTDFIPGAGGSQGFELRAASLSDTEWYEIGDSAYLPAATPITASSAQVRAYIRTAATTNNGYQVCFDRIILSLNGTVEVALQSFTID